MKFLTKHKSLLTFTLLNYIDKGLSFTVPLFVLYLLKDIALYNSIEYVFSIANIIIVFADFGLRIFFLYDYSRQHEEEEHYLERIKSYYYLLNLGYFVLGIGLFFISRDVKILGVLAPYIYVRSLMMLFFNFFNVYFRLVDKPGKVLVFSIVVNLMTMLVVFINEKLFSSSDSVFYFFLVQLLFIGAVALKGFKYIRKPMLKPMIEYVKESLKYAWPLMLNVLILTFINNYGKIYAFNNLSKESMFSFAYVLRIGMIIQMAHASVMAYYSKAIYTDTSHQLNYKIYKLYNVFLGLSILISFALLVFINYIKIIPAIRIDSTSVMLFIYIFIWCQVAYFEQYLSRANKNKLILIFAVVSSCIYILMLSLAPNVTLNYIAFSMLVSIVLNVVAVLLYLKKFKLL